MKKAGSERGKRIPAVPDVPGSIGAEERKRVLSPAGERGPAIVIITDAAGKIEYVNPRFATVTGFAPEEAIGQHVSSLGQRSPEEERQMGDALASGGEWHEEFRNRRKDGEVYWVPVSFFPARSPDGAVTHFLGVNEDVTGRRRAEGVLQDSGEQWWSLVESIPDMIMTLDRGGTVLYMNRTPAGYTMEGVVGSSVYLYVPSEYHETLKNILKRVFEAGETQRYEIPAAGPIGFTSWYFSRIAPISRDGSVMAAVLVATDITEKRGVEEALRESEELFRTAFEQAAIGMALVAPDGHLLRVNRACWESLGYTEQELLTMNWQAITHPDDLEATLQHVRRVLKGEVHSYQMRKRFVHKLGHVLWGDLSSSVHRDAAGKPLYFITQIQDITARMRAEEALRQSQERYRDLVENINDVIYEIDASGLITYISPSVKDLAGYDPSEILGRNFVEFIHQDDLTAVAHSFQRGLAGIQETTEYRIWSKSGGIGWFRSDGRPILKDGRVLGFRGVLTDMTERKLAEQALRESEERFRRIVELFPYAIIVHRDGKLVFVNRVGVELIGAADPGDIVGKDLWDFVHPEYVEAVKERVLRMGPEGDKVDLVEEKLVRLDGQIIDVEMAAIPIAYEGRPARQVVFRDVTERKRMEELLEKTRDELESKVERQMQGGSAYGLTFRELTVLHLVTAGRSDKGIATLLGISPSTASKHLANILEKMNAASRTEAGVRAVKEGLVD